MKNKKAFTLIEILIVIAIIGILAAVVLVMLYQAKLRAKDASIIASANSIMKAAQVDASGAGNYAWWKMNGWLPKQSGWTCENTFSSIPIYGANVVAACNSILANSTKIDKQVFYTAVLMMLPFAMIFIIRATYVRNFQ